MTMQTAVFLGMGLIVLYALMALVLALKTTKSPRRPDRGRRTGANRVLGLFSLIGSQHEHTADQSGRSGVVMVFQSPSSTISTR